MGQGIKVYRSSAGGVITKTLKKTSSSKNSYTVTLNEVIDVPGGYVPLGITEVRMIGDKAFNAQANSSSNRYFYVGYNKNNGWIFTASLVFYDYSDTLTVDYEIDIAFAKQNNRAFDRDNTDSYFIIPYQNATFPANTTVKFS